MTTLTGKQIAVDQMASVTSGNLLRYNGDGLYVALQAAANVAVQYVSSSAGSDSNDGSRASPLKTIAYALSRVPPHTSSTIYLYETDTFPIRALGDPATWGTAINYFGSTLNMGLSNIVLHPYGPQYDAYAVAAAGVTGFAGWQIAAAPRPILEFGHYLYNGRPVGCQISLGSTAGQRASIYGCDIRVTQAARDAATASNSFWSAQGGSQLIIAVTSTIAGCKFPSPVTVTSGKTWVVSMYEDVSFWQCYIPVETTPWIVCGGTTKLNFSDTGPTTYDKNGTAYATLTNTVTTNITTRIEGVVKDTNGVTRNIFSNLDI